MHDGIGGERAAAIAGLASGHPVFDEFRDGYIEGWNRHLRFSFAEEGERWPFNYTLEDKVSDLHRQWHERGECCGIDCGFLSAAERVFRVWKSLPSPRNPSPQEAADWAGFAHGQVPMSVRSGFIRGWNERRLTQTVDFVQEGGPSGAESIELLLAFEHGGWHYRRGDRGWDNELHANECGVDGCTFFAVGEYTLAALNVTDEDLEESWKHR